MRIDIGRLFYYIKSNYYELLSLRSFRNFLMVGIRAKFRLYPMKVVMKKDNAVITVYNQNHLQLLKWDNDVFYDNVERFFRINTNDGALIFYGAENNGDIPGIFYRQEYDSLNVDGKTVIDVGANIGDSSVYFAYKGARKVIAVEPNILSFNSLLKNIRTNAMNDRIVPINGALGCRDGFAKMTKLDNNNGTLFDGIQEISKPDKNSIPVMNINRIISDIHDGGIVLKIDCEGCEYNLINCIERGFPKTIRYSTMSFLNIVKSPNYAINTLKYGEFHHVFPCIFSKFRWLTLSGRDISIS